MSFPKWLISGFAAAAVGGIAWILIGYFANAELGWIAWGIGLLAGIGVRFAAGDRDHGFAPGLAAVAVAAAVIAASKYTVIALLVHQSIAEQIALGTPDFESDDYAIMVTADEIIETDYNAVGKEVAWPEGMNWDEASQEADYPADIWATAKDRWTTLPAAEQRTRRDTWRRNYDEGLATFEAQLRSDAFADSFSPFDLLWFGLAMYTAFQAGSGTKTTSKEETTTDDATPTDDITPKDDTQFSQHDTNTPADKTTLT